MTQPEPKPLWKADEIEAQPDVQIRHPWNPESEVYIKPLSLGAGLSRVVLSLARVPPGKESFIYHSHERDEEFLYILSGKGRAEIGDDSFEVGAGDFMGFVAPGVAHHLINSHDEDLVYLMGGERSGLDIGHFPKMGRRILFGPSGISAVEEGDLTPMSFDDWFVKP